MVLGLLEGTIIPISISPSRSSAPWPSLASGRCFFCAVIGVICRLVYRLVGLETGALTIDPGDDAACCTVAIRASRNPAHWT